jgi:hypothetical protein
MTPSGRALAGMLGVRALLCRLPFQQEPTFFPADRCHTSVFAFRERHAGMLVRIVVAALRGIRFGRSGNGADFGGEGSGARLIVLDDTQHILAGPPWQRSRLLSLFLVKSATK